ncbi:hypothetical protein GCM10010503_22360 [Streptomyces lucensis JCM 4490]|uniref:Uncharacterized protein n=1 Tax=Streptomyces lucensis JCM 4490 TaxID=1306176 RepID=A0A918J396_9ACTN|nr:hypothetical protein [Streptomyces lucensis]GGW44916.1 hypothetical protein GCM10010503_22360 [Streptomyces lucensis JCM 4490]
MRVKPLIQNADPVPHAARESLSARAAGELAALVGPDAAVPPPARPDGRPTRRGFLMAAVATGAAVAVGGTALFGLRGDPDGPGGRPTGPGGGAVADEPYFGGTADLEGAATLIVRARLGAGHEETVEGVGTTVAPAKVVATAKGRVPGAEIQVFYTTPGSGPETTGFTAGQEYVLLLEEGAGGRYFLVNTTQGWYAVEDGAAVPGKDNRVALSPEVRRALRLAPRHR